MRSTNQKLNKSTFRNPYRSDIPITPQDAIFGAEFTRDLNDFDGKNSKEYSLYFEDFSHQNHLKVDVKSDAKNRILRCNGYR